MTLSATAVTILAFALAFSGAAKTEKIKDADKLKVFVGTYVEADNPEEALRNADEKLDGLTGKAVETRYEAVLTFSEYVRPEEFAADGMAAFEDNAVTVNRVYYWVPGETGRAMVTVIDNDVTAAIQRGLGYMKDDPDNEERIKTGERMENGDIGVFALVVEGKAADLKALKKELSYIKAVDVLYDSKIEEEAKNSGRETSYIIAPEKPDAKDGVS